MLLEFKTKNYKSFKSELVFSMLPAPKQKGLDYSVLSEQIGSKVYKGLCSAVVYGPNASGKTNLIGAMEVFKSVVLRGDIRNSDGRNEPNVALNKLELIPNAENKEREPTFFSIKFIESGLLLEYKLLLDFGKFLEKDYKRKILSESLFIDDTMIFSRNDTLNLGNLKIIENYWVNGFRDSEAGVANLAKNNLNDEELFLMNGFKVMFSSKLVNIISSWLENKLTVIYRADAVQTISVLPNPKEKTVYIQKSFNEAARMFGVSSNRLGLIVNEEDSKPTRISILDGERAVLSEVFESYGTIRFLNIFPLIERALISGGTLIVDEFDASLHPMALMSIINVFHNDDINTKNAQLIFNTHNPIFLNSNLFRRDEIKFVERDEVTHFSTHYSLSDFGTSGVNAVRRHEDYMKNYFVSRYGAIKDVDFSTIFENLLNNNEEV
ncbi:ATP/GTP-binding protein [Paenibacillus sp. NRS-1782]|uniref:AAA family ATPase n=1 Tax=unclassified Paenibacillus TaxID=185978 RepID=UPI003D2E39F2